MTNPNPGFARGDRSLIVGRGVDNSRWILSGRGQGKQGAELSRGLVGIDRPPSELLWLQDAHQNGADLVGNNVDVRTIRGAVNIMGTNPRSYRDSYARWNGAQSLEEYFRIFFANSYSGVRWLDALCGESPNMNFDREPSLRNGAYGVPVIWVCPNPYFKGFIEEFSWRSTKVVDGWLTGEVAIRNLGDAPKTYPQIYLPGPGIWKIPRGNRDAYGNLIVDDPDADFVELPYIGPNTEVWINTDPTVDTIVSKTAGADGEVNLWAQMKAQRPRLWLPGSRPGDLDRGVERWPLSVSGGSSLAKPKIAVQPLYNNYQ